MIERAGRSSGRWPPYLLAAVAALAVAAALAGRGAVTDSVTVDEPSHLIAGYAALRTGDFRLSPDHPPLGRLLLALPLLAEDVSWNAEGTPAWQRGDFFALGRGFFESLPDGQKMALPSRAIAIALLLLLLLSIAAAARTLFGAAGGLLALWVAAFDPAFLAHGHLATMDVPFVLAVLLTLLAAHRWLERPTPGRLALLAVAFSVATLVKFSWFALVPALLGMAIFAPGLQLPRGKSRRLRTLGIATAALALASVFAIWTTYGFRYTAARGTDATTATMHVLGDFGRPLPTTPEGAWESVLHDPATGADRSGLSVPVVRALRAARLLPEAYLYGIAYVGKKAETRASYLHGRYSLTGFPDYFFWALVLKTPLPTLALFAAGILAALFSAARFARADSADSGEDRGARVSPLAIGLVLFALCYLVALAASGLNLGYRHLLPVTAILAIGTGGLAPSRFPARFRTILAIGLGGALVWLAAGTFYASPLLLGYFNEAAGGYKNGHRYLADSNLDWGQDLLRLAERLRTEPAGRTVWLAQAGDPPLPQELAPRIRWLLGEGSHAPAPEPIAGGLFAISATDLVGVYRPLARSASWRDPRLQERYERIARESRLAHGDRPIPVDIEPFEAFRRLRLIARLASRPADERIGTSLFLFRLSDDQVAEMTEP